ncbi:DUF418 domain-containing protein [soil metagenome]
MSASTNSLPVSERIATLDIVRGFALMGILIMNMSLFSENGYSQAGGNDLWPSPFDSWTIDVIDGLFSGKFNSMFSMLFGLGFTIQYARLQQRFPDQATSIYVRRLLVLLVVGLIHFTLFWNGDVLHTYALLGFLLIPLRRVSNRTILVLIAVCFLMPLVSNVIRLMTVSPELIKAYTERALAMGVTNEAAYGHGTFLDAAREHVRQADFMYGSWRALWGSLNWYTSVSVTMLMGVMIGRLGWARRIPELLPKIPRVQWGALALGLVCSAAFSTIFHYNHGVPGPSLIKMLGGFLYSLSRISMMVFYVTTLVRIAQTATGSRRLAPFAAAGRMPLTNYLMQTAICTTLFYHWGFGLWNTVNPIGQFAIAQLIFWVIQVPWSFWWLKHHERGPLEALWARLTYGGANRDAVLAHGRSM